MNTAEASYEDFPILDTNHRPILWRSQHRFDDARTHIEMQPVLFPTNVFVLRSHLVRSFPVRSLEFRLQLKKKNNSRRQNEPSAELIIRKMLHRFAHICRANWALVQWFVGFVMTQHSTRTSSNSGCVPLSASMLFICGGSEFKFGLSIECVKNKLNEQFYTHFESRTYGWSTNLVSAWRL